MDKTELRAIIYAKIDELPTLPAVLPKVLSLIEDKKTDSAAIADVVSSDPALTSKILKVANSAYYGFQQQIASLDRAIPLLGFNMVKSLTLSLGVMHSLPADQKSSHFSLEGLWLHSLAVASMMQEYGKQLKKNTENEHLFIVGLLHDIGKVVLDHFFSDLFHLSLEQSRRDKCAESYKIEYRIIGMDHGEVGAMLLNRWKFPPTITDPIEHHHNPEIATETFSADMALLRIADLIPKSIGLGEDIKTDIFKNCENELVLLGLGENDLDDMKCYLSSISDRIHAFFNAMS